MMVEATTGQTISLFRLRLGILLFILWWLPVYLMVPAIVDALGYKGNHHATVFITATIVILQTIVGIIGILLTGKELAFTLKKVKYKKLPITIWRMVWSGTTEIDPSFLKPVKAKKQLVKK